MFRTSFVVALFLAVGALAAPPESDFAKYTRLGEQAYAEGRYAEAADTLIKAYAIKPVPTLVFNTARAFERAGNDEQAMRFYQRYLDAEGTEPETVKKAARALDLLRTKQADAKAAEAAKQAAAREEAAKEAAAKAAAAEVAAATARAQADAEAARQAAAAAQAKATPPRRPSLVPGLVMLGVTAVALASGITFGVLANGQVTAFNTTFDATARPLAKQRAQTNALVADISYGVSVVAAGFAAYFIIHSLTGTEEAPVSLSITGSGANLVWSTSW